MYMYNYFLEAYNIEFYVDFFLSLNFIAHIIHNKTGSF